MAIIEDSNGYREYETWDELVEAETNGWVATVILRKKRRNGEYVYWTWTLGPFDDKRLATNARGRLRSKLKKDHESHPEVEIVGYTVRPAWKDV